MHLTTSPASGKLTSMSLIYEHMDQWLQAVIVTALFAVIGLATRAVGMSGCIGGFIIGVLVYGSLGMRGFILLLVFFIIGTACTKFGYSKKEEKGIAQESGGARSAKHALAKGLVAIIAAIAYFFLPDANWIIVGFTAALATAAADTASSEIGQLLGRTPILITSFKVVEPGTEGAVSLEGPFAGIIAGAILGALAWVFWPEMGWAVFVAVTLASFIGNLIESLLGATLENLPWITNEHINFLNTLIGAIIGILLFLLLS
jgi:uncharacterized protein (TIGR00297 family)